MSQIVKKILIIFSAVVFVLFIALLVGAWQLGAFARVSLILQERAPAFYLCRAEKVPYAQIPQQLEEIKTLAAGAVLTYKESGALIYSDPASTPLNEIEAQALIFLADSAVLPAPLLLKKTSGGPVLSATFQAHPTIAVFKIYPALSDWLFKNQPAYQPVFPLLEIHRPPFYTVQLPLLQKQP